MSVYTRYRGDDITLSVTVGSSVDIDNLAELFVYVVYERTGTALIKFSKAGGTGYTALDKISTTEYEAIIPSSVTTSATVGRYRIEGNVVVTDADYDESEENQITVSDYINLVDSTIKSDSSE